MECVVYKCFGLSEIDMRHLHAFLLTLVGFILLEPYNVLLADDLFLDDILPILQENCLSCHNSTESKGDFAIDTRDGLFESGFLIKGKPTESHFVDVITPDASGKAKMPKGKEALSKQEIAAIEKWILAGAPWPADFTKIEPAVVTDTDWWSLQAIDRDSVPSIERVPEGFTIENPIDAFVLAKQLEHGLHPSPRADRHTLLRRLYFDLTGLPPTPEQVNAFMTDQSPLAYERLVDQLLASPAYGERWARHWLDVVKYADTCGYDKDKLRPNAWPYRDYVVHSFNQDKPYTRFVNEQIAGDVLYPNTSDGILGLGFIAAGPWDFIGHVEVPESKIDGKIARYLDRDDMVTNTLNTFTSTTIQCARCHNHKFDPITQQHYYNLHAVFAAVDKAERTYGVDARVEQQKSKLTSQINSATNEIASINKAIADSAGDTYKSLKEEAAQFADAAKLKTRMAAYGYHSKISAAVDKNEWLQVDLGESVAIAEIRIHPTSDDFNQIGNGFGFPTRFRIECSDDPTFKESKVVADQTQFDYPKVGLAYYSSWPESISARYVRITATKLTSRLNDYIMAISEIVVLNEADQNVALNKMTSAATSIEQGERWGKQNATDGIWPLPEDVAKTQTRASLLLKAEVELQKARTPERVTRLSELAKIVQDSQAALDAQPTGRMVYAAATEFNPRGGFQPTKGKPRPINVLYRGDILKPGEPATPGTIPVFANTADTFPLPEDHTEGDRRAALAHWLTRDDHPLTWRSIVNRVWQYHFGRGIVSSSNDFGRMGELPTHPRLLDWLAAEFRDHGQSIKDLHRLIVFSSTYQQASTHIEQNAAVDGSNRFLWRMNRRRLSAEEIRDSILVVSGRLDNRMGGEGYYLFELERPEHSPHYEYHKHDPRDENSHRRSIYRFIVRSQPDPFMTALDCADSSQSTPTRDETITSIQALALLNNKFNLAMAEYFSQDLLQSEQDLRGQVQLAFERITGRKPAANDLQALVQYAQQHDLANLCRLLYNLNEFVYVD